MPDIEKCNNINCPIKLTCYRYVSTPSSYQQAYNKFTPVIESNGSITCEGFWKLRVDTNNEFKKSDERK
jgi:hypothetical protein